jgi:hypothetical protein
MNEYALSRLRDGLRVEDLELMNTMATHGRAHYGEEIENVRGVVRGFTRMTEGPNGARVRVGNNEHIESTVALNFSPPHIAGPATERLLRDVNSVGRNTSLSEIASIYQRAILTHPFSDGTGRTSFGILDYMLVRSGRAPLPHSAETGIPLFKPVSELVAEFERAYRSAAR